MKQLGDHMTIRIRKADGNWSVRAGGAVLAESKNALELSEDTLESVIYFPRSDIAMAFLDENEHRTECRFKGTANYFSIQTKSTTLHNAAWSFENPNADAERIKGYLSFDIRQVTVERV